MSLVIGYGNSLRGDDGVGLAVARGLPGALAIAQLTPELALPLSYARRVIFVDATWLNPPGVLAWRDITPAEGHLRPHGLTPSILLALARALYGHAPPARLLTIGVASCEGGETLSAAVADAVPRAVRSILRECRTRGDEVQGGPLNSIRGL